MSAQVLDFPVPTAPAPASQPRLVLVPSPAPEPTYSLTRRGRLVLALLVAAVSAAVALALSGQLASAAGEPHSITVQSGDTLSEIAARELPLLPIADGIVELQVANNLATSQVHAGQTLVVPSDS